MTICDSLPHIRSIYMYSTFHEMITCEAPGNVAICDYEGEIPFRKLVKHFWNLKPTEETRNFLFMKSVKAKMFQQDEKLVKLFCEKILPSQKAEINCKGKFFEKLCKEDPIQALEFFKKYPNDPSLRFSCLIDTMWENLKKKDLSFAEALLEDSKIFLEDSEVQKIRDWMMNKNYGEFIKRNFEALGFLDNNCFFGNYQNLFSLKITSSLFEKLSQISFTDFQKKELVEFFIHKFPNLFLSEEYSTFIRNPVVEKALEISIKNASKDALKKIFFAVNWETIEKDHPICNSISNFFDSFTEEILKNQFFVKKFFNQVGLNNPSMFLKHYTKLFKLGINTFLIRKLSKIPFSEYQKVEITQFCLSESARLFLYEKDSTVFTDKIIAKGMQLFLDSKPDILKVQYLFYSFNWKEIETDNPICKHLLKFQELLPEFLLGHEEIIFRFPELIPGWEIDAFSSVIKGMAEKEGIFDAVPLDVRYEIAKNCDKKIVADKINVFQLTDNQILELFAKNLENPFENFLGSFEKVVNSLSPEKRCDFVHSWVQFSTYPPCVQDCELKKEEWYVLFSKNSTKISNKHISEFHPELWKKEQQQQVFQKTFPGKIGSPAQLRYFSFISKEVRTECAINYLKDFHVNLADAKVLGGLNPCREIFEKIKSQLPKTYFSELAPFLFPFATDQEIFEIVSAFLEHKSTSNIQLLIDLPEKIKSLPVFKKYFNKVFENEFSQRTFFENWKHFSEELLPIKKRTAFFNKLLNERSKYLNEEKLIEEWNCFGIDFKDAEFNQKLIQLVGEGWKIDQMLSPELFHQLQKDTKKKLFPIIIKKSERKKDFFKFEGFDEKERIEVANYLIDESTRDFLNCQELFQIQTKEEQFSLLEMIIKKEYFYLDKVPLPEIFQGEDVLNLFNKIEDKKLNYVNFSWCEKLKGLPDETLSELFYRLLEHVNRYKFEEFLKYFPYQSLVLSESHKKAFYSWGKKAPGKAFAYLEELFPNSNNQDQFVAKVLNALNEQGWECFGDLPLKYQEKYRNTFRIKKPGLFLEQFSEQDFRSSQEKIDQFSLVLEKIPEKKLKKIDFSRVYYFNKTLDQGLEEKLDLWFLLREKGEAPFLDVIFSDEKVISQEACQRFCKKLDPPKNFDDLEALFEIQVHTENFSQDQLVQTFQTLLEDKDFKTRRLSKSVLTSEFMLKVSDHSLLFNRLLDCESKLITNDLLFNLQVSKDERKEMALKLALKGFYLDVILKSFKFSRKEEKKILRSKFKREAYSSYVKKMKHLFKVKFSTKETQKIIEEGKFKYFFGGGYYYKVENYLPFFQFENFEEEKESFWKICGEDFWKRIEYFLSFCSPDIIRQKYRSASYKKNYSISWNMIPHLEKLVPILGRESVVEILCRLKGSVDDSKLDLPFLTSEEKNRIKEYRNYNRY